MKRREFIKGSAVAAAGLSLGSGSLFGRQKRPNVLLIIVDQMRYPRWTPELRTPNIDRIAAQGVSFTRGYCSAVPCSPSRACLLTGTYTTQNQVYQNVDWLFFSQPSLDPGIPTAGHIFGKAGYHTPYRGKWHLTRRKYRNEALIPYGFEGWMEVDPATGEPCNCGEDAGGGANCGFSQDPILARQATDWLSDPANHKEPWFMVCSLVNPHDICEYPRHYPETKKWPIRTKEAPPNYTDDLSTKPRVQSDWRRGYGVLMGKIEEDNPDDWRRYLDFYTACIEDVDRHIGMVLDALEKSGQADNTIVVFTSDHGDMGGSHQLRAKGPMAYEEVINIPMMFSWPGHIPEGVTTEALAANVDILPTLTSRTGVSNSNYTAGFDLSPILASPASASVREDVIYHMNADTRPPRSRAAKAIMSAISTGPGQIRAIRTRDWKYAHYFDQTGDEAEYELYDLKNDPLEMTNLAHDHGYRRKMKQLADRLMELERKQRKEFGI